MSGLRRCCRTLRTVSSCFELNPAPKSSLAPLNFPASYDYPVFRSPSLALTPVSGKRGSPDQYTRVLYLVSRFNPVQEISSVECYHIG